MESICCAGNASDQFIPSELCKRFSEFMEVPASQYVPDHFTVFTLYGPDGTVALDQPIEGSVVYLIGFPEFQSPTITHSSPL